MSVSYRQFEGNVCPGFQFASGLAVGRQEHPSPFPEGTLVMQQSHFRARDWDLENLIPGLVWATINVRLDHGLILKRADRTLESVDWTRGTEGVQIPPETFSFVYCCLAHQERYYPGLIYYPHPETKPDTNEHDFKVLEILTSRVANLEYGHDVTVLCRSDAFRKKLT